MGVSSPRPWRQAGIRYRPPRPGRYLGHLKAAATWVADRPGELASAVDRRLEVTPPWPAMIVPSVLAATAALLAGVLVGSVTATRSSSGVAAVLDQVIYPQNAGAASVPTRPTRLPTTRAASSPGTTVSHPTSFAVVATAPVRTAAGAGRGPQAQGKSGARHTRSPGGHPGHHPDPPAMGAPPSTQPTSSRPPHRERHHRARREDRPPHHRGDRAHHHPQHSHKPPAKPHHHPRHHRPPHRHPPHRTDGHQHRHPDHHRHKHSRHLHA